MNSYTQLIYICIGGALGAGARYLFSLWAIGKFGAAFPWGTFLVNALGSFILAFILAGELKDSFMTPNFHLAICTGLLGGFTTYSTFSFEMGEYFQQGAYRAGMTYVLATLLICSLATAMGFVLGGLWSARA